MQAAGSNWFLNALPPDILEPLRPRLEAVTLPVGTRLYEPEERPRYVHFLTGGLCSIVMEMEVGDTAEVMATGREGLVQALHLLGPGLVPTRGFMQLQGTGLRMPFSPFQKLFLENLPVRDLVLRHVQYQTAMVSQVAACNRLHRVEARLARWLLMVEDRIDDRDLPLTQQFLAEMLGTQRPTVTETAGALQKSGCIQYTRGKVRILDRKRLEGSACVCYEASVKLLRNLNGHHPR